MKSKLLIFVAITYVVTIIFHMVLLLTNNPLNYVGITMIIPFIVALFVQKKIYNEDFILTLGLKAGKIKWYLIAIIIPVFLSFDYTMSLDEWLKMLLIGLTIASISALFEEVIWRGFVRYEMRNKNVIFTYLVTALIWTAWHIPISVLFLYSEHILLNTFFHSVQLFLISMIISWIRDKSHTVITAAIFHGMVNVFYFS
ncbi:CPBP family intramembrane glutamic endopeptidase [Paenibacillus campinasensis]|uniref:CAAX prenyl protease 2/Lysostaphin resistance protein A-like domain-containing protein n=1 Tax=Paenibacillus campinasensis TaxID=66347 RepID=A0A268EJ86_9BACL|nr:CPBP family intramembrane glutamic endopeptidase [Paenibacillus campinasensis]PAD73197.1 hypothetical protein CHH67_20675 [Paenibacillus campinasensis]